MPVTVRFSKNFHDKLGEQAADELVNWMNAVHEKARADLLEFNELNFARFDARLDGIDARLDGIDARFDRSNARLVGIDARLDRIVDAKLDRAEFHAALAEFESRFDKKFDARFAAFAAQMDARFAQMDARFERAYKEQIRFVFLAWSALLIPMIGFWMRG